MSLTRIKLVLAMIGCALAAANSGCSASWPAPSQTKAGAAATPLPESVPTVAATYAGTEPDAKLDLASVLDKLQQVRAIDPAAEQKLLDELRRTPAKSWPLVAEQFRSSLAYHQQLSSRTAETPVVQRGSTEGRIDSAAVSPSQQSLAAIDHRPSAPIRALVDPRRAEADGVSSESLAMATPFSMPLAVAELATESPKSEPDVPAEFVASGPAYPIAGHFIAAGPSVVQTRLETLAEPSAAAPIEPPAAANWQQLVKQAADDLNDRVSDSPATTAEIHQHVSLRMLRLLAGDTEAALAPIPHVGPTEQDYWSRQLFALATYLDHHSQPDDKRRAAASVTQLDEAVANLRELGSLSLRNLSFCKKVHGYGAIEPFDSDVFSPGQQVSLYVEVENYHSQSTEKGFCTSLGSTYEILDEGGERVTGGEFPDVEDCCRSRRRDFHIQYGLALPEKLAPGRYQLQVFIKDRQSDKLGNATAAFEIRGSRL